MISFGLFSLALLAGALAAFNPCGFGLLPAYLTHVIAGGANPVPGPSLYLRAIRFSLGMTVGFIGVFGGFALFITPIAGTVQKYLPVVTILVGIMLIAWSVSLLLGKNLFLKKIANPNIAPNEKWLSQVGYGVTFALASLSCTIGPFLAITATAVRSRNFLKSLILFATYSLGMGLVVLILALSVAGTRSRFLGKIKSSNHLISILTGLFFLVVGLYQTWYGWFEIRILRGDPVSDPIITFAISIQSRIVRALADVGSISLVILSSAIIAVLLVSGYRSKMKKAKSLTKSE